MSAASRVVALVGAPNVGKSTLFNRLTRGSGARRARRGFRRAIVDAAPGVTRDRREEPARLAELRFRLVDTPGLETLPDAPRLLLAAERVRGGAADAGRALRSAGRGGEGEELWRELARQTTAAVSGADVVLFMFDARIGVTALDRAYAHWLRSLAAELEHRPRVLAVANKCEAAESSSARASDAASDVISTVGEAWSLGLGEPVAVAAEHGIGMADLYVPLAKALQGERAAPTAGAAVADAQDSAPTLAILGRRNVGKSSLLNALSGTDRAVVGALAGMTREPVLAMMAGTGSDAGSDADAGTGDELVQIRLVDTAGMRRRAELHDAGSRVDAASQAATVAAVGAAHVVMLVIDAREAVWMADLEGGGAQSWDVRLPVFELQLARMAIDQGKALVLVINKIDLLHEVCAMQSEQLVSRVRAAMPQWMLGGSVPVLATSALSGEGLDQVSSTFRDVFRQWNANYDRGTLNRWLEQLLRFRKPPAPVRYMRQITTRPPTFALFVGRRALPEAYIKFLASSLRNEFGLQGCPVRVIQRTGTRRYREEASGATKKRTARRVGQ